MTDQLEPKLPPMPNCPGCQQSDADGPEWVCECVRCGWAWNRKERDIACHERGRAEGALEAMRWARELHHGKHASYDECENMNIIDDRIADMEKQLREVTEGRGD